MLLNVKSKDAARPITLRNPRKEFHLDRRRWQVDRWKVSQYDISHHDRDRETIGFNMSRWTPETAKKVEILMAEIIDLADTDVLDVVRSRQVEQEVLDIVDGRKAG
jgi:hypothetical protein